MGPCSLLQILALGRGHGTRVVRDPLGSLARTAKGFDPMLGLEASPWPKRGSTAAWMGTNAGVGGALGLAGSLSIAPDQAIALIQRIDGAARPRSCWPSQRFGAGLASPWKPQAPTNRSGGTNSQLGLLLRSSRAASASIAPRSPLAALPTVPAANPQAEALRTSLNGRGQRLTPQRQRVLGLFERIGEGSHLSAEEVHQRLLRGEEKVSLATVYRTLRLLSSMQLLQELELPDGGRRFELAGDTNRDHHHLVCVRCGQTEEFESHDVLKAGERAAGLHGFRLLECVLNVRAVCPRCTQAEGA